MTSAMHSDWDSLKDLECPVCYEYMTSEIWMCENGHNVCNSCRGKVVICPSCRGSFSGDRNINLENFAANAIYPCKNREAGCEGIFTLEERNKHLFVCQYEIINCPFEQCSDLVCRWTGPLTEVTSHTAREHYRETAEVGGYFKVNLREFCRRRIYYQAVFILEELYYLICVTEADTFTFDVFHFDPNYDSGVLKYGVKIGCSDDYIALTGKCLSYLECECKDMQLGACININFSTIEKYVREDNILPCEVEIGKEKLNWFVSAEMQEGLPVLSATVSDIRSNDEDDDDDGDDNDFDEDVDYGDSADEDHYNVIGSYNDGDI